MSFLRVFRRSDLPLSEGELADRRRRQRKLLTIAGALLILLLIGYLSARPTVNLIHAWQARRHADKAFAFIDQEQWTDARKEAVAAYQLRSTEPQAIRAVARLLSRAGQPDALNFWKDLAARVPLTKSDLRDEATTALRVKEIDVADEAIKKLLDNANGGPAPSDWLIAADLAMQKQDVDGALSHVRRIFASTSASEHHQFQATLLLDKIFAIRVTSNRTEVLSRLAGLAHSKQSTGLDALVALGQQVLAAKDPWGKTAGLSVDDMIQLLEAHPLAKPQHKLLAVDLQVHEHPDQRDALVQKAIDQWKEGDSATLLALAGWLNAHGEYQRELDTIPRQRAMQTRELFFQHVDALGALNRWDEIRRLIESEQFPLDPVVEHMYLARCFAQQGQTNGAENNWARALEAAAGDLGKLINLAEYAEKNGANDVAGQAYEAAVSVSPKSRLAQQGRLRIAYTNRNTQKIYEILNELIKIWPNDPAVQNDAAYARLLLLPNDTVRDKDAEIAQIRQLAEKLVERNPTSLPHRTLLAFALLKQDRPDEALAVYKGINVPRSAVSTSSVAVHSAVLAANGHLEEAKAEFSTLPADKLLPEERLMDPANKH